MRLPVAPVLAMLLSFAILAGPTGTALAQAELDHTQRIQMEVVGFLDQGEKFLLKVQDPNIGSKFEVWDSRDVKLLRAFIFVGDEERRALAQVRRAFGEIEPTADDATNPRSDVMMLVGQKGDKLNIYMMRGDRIVQYDSIDVYKDPKSNELAKANQKQAVWDKDGRYAVIIYSQKLDQRFQPVDRDYVYAFRFFPARAKFD